MTDVAERLRASINGLTCPPPPRGGDYGLPLCCWLSAVLDRIEELSGQAKHFHPSAAANIDRILNEASEAWSRGDLRELAAAMAHAEWAIEFEREVCR